MKYMDCKKHENTFEEKETYNRLKMSKDKFNVSSLIRVIQEIAEEINFDKLIGKSMDIIMEYTDTIRGIFILNKNSVYMIKGVKKKDSGKLIYQNSIPLVNFKDISYNTVQQCIKSRRCIVARNKEDTKDPYFKKNKSISSVICLPGECAGRLLTLIYLEAETKNTEIKMSFIRTILSQVAISVKNAGLYYNLQTRLKQTEQELNEKRIKLSKLLQSSNNYKKKKDQYFEKKCEQYNISPKEKETIELLIKGFLYKEISSELKVTINTVKARIKSIYKKSNVQNKVELTNLFSLELV